MNSLIPEAILILGKSTAIVAIAWVISLALRKIAPLLESYLWRITFIAILLLPVLSLQISWPGLTIETPEISIPQITQIQNTVAAEKPPHVHQPSEPNETRDSPWLATGFMILWATGALLLLIRFSAANLLLKRTRDQSVSLPETPYTEIRKRLNFRGRITVKKHSDSPTPMGFGLRNATILVPEDFDHWPEERKQYILLHELSHIARCDGLYRFASEISRCLYWINPLVWIALRRLRLSEELATDAHVISTGGNRATYAELLLQHARPNSQKTRMFDTVAAGMARSHTISKRIEWILSDRTKSFPKRHRWLPAMTVFTIGLILLSGIHFPEAEAMPPEPTDTNLWTEAYRVPLADFRNLGNTKNLSAAETLWGEHELPTGWSATYNPTSQQLVVRAWKSEHDRLKSLLPPPVTENTKVEIIAFEIPKILSRQLNKASAFKQVLAAMKSGEDVQYISSLNLSPPAGRRHSSAISGNGYTLVQTIINPADNGAADIDLGFQYTFKDGKTVRSTSTKLSINHGETKLAGSTAGRDTRYEIVIFARR